MFQFRTIFTDSVNINFRKTELVYAQCSTFVYIHLNMDFVVIYYNLLPITTVNWCRTSWIQLQKHWFRSIEWINKFASQDESWTCPLSASNSAAAMTHTNRYFQSKPYSNYNFQIWAWNMVKFWIQIKIVKQIFKYIAHQF